METTFNKWFFTFGHFSVVTRHIHVFKCNRVNTCNFEIMEEFIPLLITFKYFSVHTEQCFRDGKLQLWARFEFFGWVFVKF